jgi:hypothetical protein
VPAARPETPAVSAASSAPIPKRVVPRWIM